MLEFYAGHFDIVEVNSSFYRVMPPRTSLAMVGKTPEGFLFFLKLHGSMTHSRDATDEVWKAYSEMLEPFRAAGRLAGLLAQFPFSFRPSGKSFEWIGSLLDRFRGTPLAVEYRHEDWFAPEHLSRTVEMGAVPVSVDSPALPGLPPRAAAVGGAFGYVRFHGRNSDHWWGGGPLRYDYEYREDELKPWKSEILKLLERSGRVFLFFNNCHMGQAVRGARLMKSLLEDIG
jgi:uncharacterized protein YecE (DUF72 family)